MYSAWCAVMFEQHRVARFKKKEETIPIEYINPLFFDYWTRDGVPRNDKRSFLHLEFIYRKKKTLSHMNAKVNGRISAACASLRACHFEKCNESTSRQSFER